MIVFVNKRNLNVFQIIPEPIKKEISNFYQVEFDGEFEDLADIKFYVNDNGDCCYSHDNARHIEKAEQDKRELLDEAEQRIIILERKIRLGIATDEEKELLTAWEIYSVKIADADTSQAPDVDWGIKPE
ncbi:MULTISPECIES: tail fiber assembly protein [Providencia]|uniref:tail fiber assembly protein n=1 Tax=Providencia TaxID=586 RepID=UPI0024803D4A|nr:tail fiber assembly protein [Providencia rettgeri]MDU7494286.1 tail fiber assembly protein [Providencia rettgeri]HEM8306822.1 tail fiber assembly protein [Providencia rettgeri]